MCSDIAISVKNMSKFYQIYDKPLDRLKQSVFGRRKQYYKEFRALENVSFEIKKGETVGVIGRNGAGKSTLLQMICGTLAPTVGDVEVNGRVAALLELGAGFNGEFTGRENVYMNAAILGLSKKEIDDKYADIVAFSNIGEFIDQPVKTYSSGMYVRLAFSVAINVEPEILIVDEALSVGDINFQAKCMTAINRIKENGTTVLFVSHDIGTVKSLCSRCVYLDSGNVKAIGKASEIAEQYIRDMREGANADVEKESLSTRSSSQISESKLPFTNDKIDGLVFKKSAIFNEHAAIHRYGNGKAKITFAELLDEEGQPIVNVDFNQQVSIAIYFEAYFEEEVSCNYFIADEKKNLIIGASLRLAGHELLQTKKSGKYIVIYKTKLPLNEGSYSIQLQLTRPIIPDQTVEFVDVIEDAVVFSVFRRRPVRIWAQVYLPNSVQIAEA